MLSGNKIVKIVLLPVVLSITFLGVAAFLFMKFPKDLLTGLCIKQVILSVFLLYSPMWVLGLYTVILNFLVASGATTKGLAWWSYRLVFILQVFHIIAIFGPFETFHVPFGSLSTYQGVATTPTNNLEAVAGALSDSEADCSMYYGNYFTFRGIELVRKDVDPAQTTFGYCYTEWLTTVQFLTIIVGVVQCVISFRTGQQLLLSTPTASGKKDDAENATTLVLFRSKQTAANSRMVSSIRNVAIQSSAAIQKRRASRRNHTRVTSNTLAPKNECSQATSLSKSCCFPSYSRSRSWALRRSCS
jgi:hypothetical protein